MRIDLTPAQDQEVRAILSRWAPEHPVWAFGSRITGRARRYSDLDLVVLGEVPLPPERLLGLEEAFDASDLPFRVDVLDWARTSPSFQDIIRRAHLPIQ